MVWVCLSKKGGGGGRVRSRFHSSRLSSQSEVTLPGFRGRTGIKSRRHGAEEDKEKEKKKRKKNRVKHHVTHWLFWLSGFWFFYMWSRMFGLVLRRRRTRRFGQSKGAGGGGEETVRRWSSCSSSTDLVRDAVNGQGYRHRHRHRRAAGKKYQNTRIWCSTAIL